MTLDVDPRTEARFERMRPLSQGLGVRVDGADVPPGPRFSALLQSIRDDGRMDSNLRDAARQLLARIAPAQR